MKNKKLKGIDWIILTAAIVCLIAALCPYTALKSAGDHFASDGNLERLTPQTGLLLRISAGIVFLILCSLVIWQILSPESRSLFFKSILTLPGRCIRDILPFFRSLRHAMRPREWKFWAMILLFAAGAVLRVMQIQRPLMHDEAYSIAIWGRSDLLFAISDYHLPNNHVFHTVFLNLIYHHIGKSVWMLRLPVFIAGCLLIPAVWILGKLLYNDDIALGAAGLTAFAPFLTFYSVNARGYEIQALLTVLTVGLAVYGKRHRNLFAWFLLIIFSALNFFTLPIALYPFGGICVWLMLNVIRFHPGSCAFRSRVQLLKYLIFTGLSVSALTILLYMPLLRYSGWNSLFGNVFVVPLQGDVFAETMLSRLTDNIAAFSGTLPRSVSWIIAAGITLSPFVFRRTSRESISCGVSVFLWMLLIIPVQKPNLWPRTLLFLHPFLLLFCSSGIYGLGLKLRGPYVGQCVMLILVCTACISQFYEAKTIREQISADERAVQLILDREKTNAGNIHFITAPANDAPIWVYCDIYGLPGKIFDKQESFNTVYAFVNPLNDADESPRTLEELLKRFGPGTYFMDMENPEILMDEPDGILYRFAGNERAIRKGYGDYPEFPE